jgi:hypothetical protein
MFPSFFIVMDFLTKSCVKMRELLIPFAFSRVLSVGLCEILLGGWYLQRRSASLI